MKHHCLDGLVNECAMNRFLEIDDKAWTGLEETSACSPVSHHVGGVRFFSIQMLFLLYFLCFLLLTSLSMASLGLSGSILKSHVKSD